MKPGSYIHTISEYIIVFGIATLKPKWASEQDVNGSGVFPSVHQLISQGVAPRANEASPGQSAGRSARW